MMKSGLLLLGVFALVNSISVPDLKEIEPNQNRLRITAFNIQVFGLAKMDKPHVVDHLINIMLEYDIILIQEIRDASETAIYDLLDQLNDRSGYQYSYYMALSARLGRTTSKEQYAYFYDPTKVTWVDTYQEDPDRVKDIFERPPYVVRFESLVTGVADFGFLGIHVKPDDAVAEIDAMADVYDTVSTLWGLEDIILGGDFNAGCNYVGPSDWDNIRLRTDNRFMWIIDDNADTNVAYRRCAYDRLVLAGNNLIGDFVSGSASTNYFNATYGLDQSQTLEVSDHYPVDMHLL